MGLVAQTRSLPARMHRYCASRERQGSTSGAMCVTVPVVLVWILLSTSRSRASPKSARPRSALQCHMQPNTPAASECVKQAGQLLALMAL